jgi:hypothetical protein
LNAGLTSEQAPEVPFTIVIKFYIQYIVTYFDGLLDFCVYQVGVFLSSFAKNFLDQHVSIGALVSVEVDETTLDADFYFCDSVEIDRLFYRSYDLGSSESG